MSAHLIYSSNVLPLVNICPLKKKLKVIKKCQSDAMKVRPRVRVCVYNVRLLQQHHVTRSCLVVGRHSVSEEEPVNRCGV